MSSPNQRRPLQRTRRAGAAGGVRTHTITLIVGVVGTIIASVAVFYLLPLLPQPAAPSPVPTGVASAPPSISETDIRYFRPFTDAGLPADLAVKRVAGDCFGPSMTGADPAALRCSYEDVDGSPILDPCWANIERSEVACPEDPWTKHLTLIAPIIEMYEDPEADGGLETADPASDPWAMEVVSPSGVLYRCTRISAYAGDVAGLRRNYACGSAEAGVEEGFVFGDTDRSRDLWRVQFATGSSSELSFANVIRVWM